MTRTKILIGQILVVFAIVFLGLWGSSRWAAAMLSAGVRRAVFMWEDCGLPAMGLFTYEAYAPGGCTTELACSRRRAGSWGARQW